MTDRTFAPYPGWPPVMEAWNAVCLFYLIFAYPWLKTKGHPKTSGFEWYMLALVFCTPLWMGICAQREFGQSIMYGMLAVRTLIGIGGVLFLVRALRDRLITLRDMEVALLSLGWGLWILYALMRLALNPDNYVDYLGFAAPGAAGAHFILQSNFVLFTAFYYAFRGFRTARMKDYVLALVLLAGVVDRYGGREMLVSILGAFLYLVWRWGKPSRLLFFLPKFLLGSAILLGALYVAMPAAMSERLGKFGDAFSVVLTGQQVADPSANWHRFEVLYALPAIAKHPIVGNGRISNQWGGGGDVVRDTHFYPEDIGLFGVMYQCGILGLVFFAAQYWFAYRAAKKLPPGATSPLLDGVKGMVLYTAFVSFGGSLFVFFASSTLLFIALLRAISNESLAEESEWIALPRAS